MKLIVTGADISDEEVQLYKKHAEEKYGDALEGLDIQVIDSDNVHLKYHLKGESFERIRRITGYLVGTLDKWNNAKRKEEQDRVKHSVE